MFCVKRELQRTFLTLLEAEERNSFLWLRALHSLSISVMVCPLKLLQRERMLAVYLYSFCQENFQGSWMKTSLSVVLNLTSLVSHRQIFLILVLLSFRAETKNSLKWHEAKKEAALVSDQLVPGRL